MDQHTRRGYHPAVPQDQHTQDRLAAAIDVALGIQQQLGVSLEMAKLRRIGGYQALLVASALDDARRMHAALGESLNRIVAVITPQVGVEIGIVEPARPAVERG